MFNKDFFPTPIEVIEQMLYGFDCTGKVILEPSAGKGDIVDYLKDNGAKDVLACEINENLSKIIKTKCRVIGDDFLTLTSSDISHVHAIVMNPPFSADDKHILHAWDIAPAGCEIVALCNYETYRNSYTKQRERLKGIIGENGQVSNLGRCFSNSERHTDVAVGLVRLRKSGEFIESEFDGFFMDEEPEQLQVDGIMQYNAVRDLVNRYVSAVRLFDEQISLGIKMSDLVGSFYSGDLSFTCEKEGAPVLRNDFKKELQKSAWVWVLDKMNLKKYATRGLKEDINKFVEQQTTIPFTMKNIYKMLEIVIGTAGSRMDKALLEVFDKLTTHYHENRHNVEGWKTNSHYLMGEKFIIPHICYQDQRWYKGSSKIQMSSYSEILEDLQKALCYLTGEQYDTKESLYSAAKRSIYGEWFDWSFFEVKCFKKGTAHLRFKDRDVWATFNQHVARIKGYPLPEGMKSKKAA